MMNRLKFIFLFTLIVLNTSLSSCGYRFSQSLSPHPELLNQLECIAIAPLVAEAKTLTSKPYQFPQADRIIAEQLFQSLTYAHRLQIMESAEFTLAMKANGLVMSPLEIEKQLPRIAQALKVQGILTGKVLEYGYQTVDNLSEQAAVVSLELKLYHGPTGTLIWSNSIKRSSAGEVLNQRNPLSRVSQLAVEESLENLLKALPQKAATNTPNGPLSCGRWLAQLSERK
jgi:hypothetical protein